MIAKLDALEARLHNPRAKVTYDILAMKGGAQLYSNLGWLYGSVLEGDGPPTQGMREAARRVGRRADGQAPGRVPGPDRQGARRA